jgi:hypothetical protein
MVLDAISMCLLLLLKPFLFMTLCGFAAGLQKMLNAIANRPSALLPQPLLRPGSMSMQSVPSSYQEADGLGSVSRLRSLSRLSVPTSMTSCASEQGSRYVQ